MITEDELELFLDRMIDKRFHVMIESELGGDTYGAEQVEIVGIVDISGCTGRFLRKRVLWG